MNTVRTLINLVKAGHFGTVAGRLAMTRAALDAERALNARVYRWTHPEADETYGEHFGHYMRNVRQSTARADAYAVRETRKDFPNLPKWPKVGGKASR